MAKVTDSQLKGNHAELLVASWISQRCLVRPVSSGTDIGIDLFCETVHGPSGTPYLHFWVQVKSGAQVEHRADGTKAISLENTGIRYWLRQPVPVYVFLVPGDPDDVPGQLFVVSLTQQLHKDHDLATRTLGLGTTTLRSDFALARGKVDDFLSNRVPVDYVVKGAQHGVHTFVPEVSSTYIRQTIPRILGDYSLEVTDTMRRSASATLRDLAYAHTSDAPAQGVSANKKRQQMQAFADFLRHFTKARTKEEALVMHPTGEWHYEDYWALGTYQRLRGDTAGADGLLQAALDCIDADKTFSLQANIGEIRKIIESDMSPR